MKIHRFFPVLAVLLGLALVGAVRDVSAADGVPRMAKEELKGLLGDADVVVLDVRAGYDWRRSKSKIRGAIREYPGKFDSWFGKYPRDKTIVLYCA